MAEATCTAAGLIEAGNCFSSPNFSSHDQKAILAYLWWKWADSVTNNPYTSFSDIVSASECISVGLSSDKKVAGMIGVMNRGENGSGALQALIEIPVLTAATAASAIACVKQYNEAQLDGVILFSMCLFFGEFSS